jgi:hypothetical protein
LVVEREARGRARTGQQLGEFQTMLDFGGRRLALNPVMDTAGEFRLTR